MFSYDQVIHHLYDNLTNSSCSWNSLICRNPNNDCLKILAGKIFCLICYFQFSILHIIHQNFSEYGTEIRNDFFYILHFWSLVMCKAVTILRFSYLSRPWETTHGYSIRNSRCDRKQCDKLTKVVDVPLICQLSQNMWLFSL